jgi:hypothetical protein
MKIITYLLIILAMAIGVSSSTEYPTSTAHPHLFVNAARLSLMRDKKTGGELSYTFLKGRTDAFISPSEEPYSKHEMAAAMALVYNIDTAYTSHRDRAISILLDMFVNQGSGTYWKVGYNAAVITTLTSNISDSVTTIPITSGTGFDTYSGNTEYAVIGNEIISYTHYSGGNLLGVTRGIGGTTAASHSSGDTVEETDSTFRNGDRIRNAARFGLLAFDWLYNSMTTQQRSDFQAKIILWARLWAVEMDLPDGVLSSAHRYDSDQIASLAEILTYIGYCLYNDNSYSTTAFANGDSLLYTTGVDLYMGDQFKGGVWGEGMNYSPGTMPYIMLPLLANAERRGIAIPTAANTFVSDAPKAWWHMTFPGDTGILAYEDMEDMATEGDYLPLRKHYRLELMYVIEAMTSNATTKGLARKWAEMAISKEGQPDATIMYTGLWRLLLYDPAVSSVEVSPNVATDLSSEGVRFHAMRSGWGASDDVVYIYGHKDLYHHNHWTAGHYEIVHDGVILTKENSGYGYTTGVTGKSMAHNMVAIDGTIDGYGNTRGQYAHGDSTVVSSDYNSKYGFVHHDLTNLYNMDFNSKSEYPIDKYIRRFFYIKSGYLIVDDNIAVNAGETCFYTGSTYTGTNISCDPRWKKLYQHFMTEPTLSSGVYTSTTEGKKLFFKPLLPAGATASIVNESSTVPWSTAALYDLAANQKKWNVTISPPSSATTPESFLNVLHWGAESMPNTTTLSPTGMRGVHIEDATANIVSLMSTDGAANNGIVSYSYTPTATTEHYVSNLQGDYSITVTGTTTKSIVIDPSGTDYTVSSGGVLAFSVASDNSITLINTEGTGGSGGGGLTNTPLTRKPGNTAVTRRAENTSVTIK